MHFVALLTGIAKAVLETGADPSLIVLGGFQLSEGRPPEKNKARLAAVRSTIEDADMIEAIMNLQSIETTYQAALSSTAKIMKLSLVDYL